MDQDRPQRPRWTPQQRSAPLNRANSGVRPLFGQQSKHFSSVENASQERAPIFEDKAFLMPTRDGGLIKKEFESQSSTNTVMECDDCECGDPLEILEKRVIKKQIEPVTPAWNRTICSVKVCFPYTPYPSQIALMDKVLRCLTSDKNGLLESPTGSGKSLSLLCSSLAWQKTIIDAQGQNESMDSFFATLPSKSVSIKKHSFVPPKPENHCLLSEEDEASEPLIKQRSRPNITAVRSKPNFKKPRGAKFSDSEEEEETVDSTQSMESSPQVKTEKMDDSWARDDDAFSQACMDYEESFHEAQKPPGVPKIFFASRTHKQISQLVRELRKTPYAADIKMTVLGSRNQYCIHEDVKNGPNKDEKCAKLLEAKPRGGSNRVEDFQPGETCMFYKNTPAPGFFTHQYLDACDIERAFDIEDLAEKGLKEGFCPFFGSSRLLEESLLVFCPYNYLIDARIRESKDIELRGNVVIFDEGHNMEDAAREAASYTVTSSDLELAIEDMKKVAAVNESVRHHINFLKECLSAFLAWIIEQGGLIQSSQEHSFLPLDGYKVTDQLTEFGLYNEGGFQSSCEEVIKNKKRPQKKSSRNEPEREVNEMTVSAHTLQLLRGMLVIISYLFRDSRKHVPDYRFNLQKDMSLNESYQQNGDGWRNKRRKASQAEWVFKLNFWCMNPGVAFGDFAAAKAVVLTSGTLSPLLSFQSELGMQFHVQFEANHVIDMQQVFPAGVSRGPLGHLMLGNYQNVQSSQYQDDVGEALKRICQIVPKGVLCFFSSYSVLNTVMNRWKETGTWDELESLKKIFEEPRNTYGDKQIFERTMQGYYKAIAGKTLRPGQTGALMFAVFRGKISEGLDFADDKARAVVTVGIPYPNFKDEQVRMKQEFNAANKAKGFLDPRAWYDIQAFRALNQALGRCLRHKNDWGAIILLDSRFVSQDPKYTQSLSKWMRNYMRKYDNFNSTMADLARFVQHRLRVDEEQKPKVKPESPAISEDSSHDVEIISDDD